MLKDFRSKRRRVVPLGDDTTVTLRTLGTYDFITLGEIPEVVFGEGTKEEKKAQLNAVVTKNRKLVDELVEICMVKGIIEVDGEPVKVMNKPIQDCGEGEVSLSEFTVQDTAKIFDACLDMIGFDKKKEDSATKPGTFQEEAATSTPG